MSYVLIDLSNLFYRARHAVRGDIDLKIGMSLSIAFNSIKKAYTDFGGKHVIICSEGRSWRKSYYEPYKRNRSVTKAAMTPIEVEEDELFWQAYNELFNFLNEKTNCTVLQHPQLEADDLIAGFIQNHPDNNHVIISTDTDFYQLLAPNVTQYNGVEENLITLDGFFDKKGNRIKDKKTDLPKAPIDPKWALFEKCIRGDTSDNIFSAYPGVRTKGTKNKIGLLDAFADKNDKGYSWNNLMLSRWTDHNGAEHRVLDDYQRNVTLIDLSAQPANIREIIDNHIKSIVPKQVPMVGVHFIKMCAKHNLVNLEKQANVIGDILSKPYQEKL